MMDYTHACSNVLFTMFSADSSSNPDHRSDTIPFTSAACVVRPKKAGRAQTE